jgi:O-antigen/teichoic acid export membrane protein
VTRQFAAILVSRLAGAVIQALVGIVLARSVLAAEYGQITAITGALLFWFIVCSVGIPSYLGRARALGANDDVATALVLNIVTSILGGAVAAAALLLGLVPIDLAGVLVLLVIGTALDKNVDASLSVAIADGERLRPAVSVLLRRLTTAAVFFGLLLAGLAAIPAYCIATAAGPLLGQVHASLTLRRAGVHVRVASSWRGVLRDSVPFAVNDIAIQSRTLDVAVTAIAAGPTAAGLYSAAAKLVAPFELVSSTLAAVVLPHATRMAHSGARRAALLLGAAGLALVIPAGVLAFLAGPIVVFLLGEQYADAAVPLAILVFSLPAIGLTSPYSSLLQGRGRHRFVAITSTAFAVATIAAIALGAVLGGAIGAAVAVLAVTTAKAVVLFWALLTLQETRED